MRPPSPPHAPRGVSLRLAPGSASGYEGVTPSAERAGCFVATAPPVQGGCSAGQYLGTFATAGEAALCYSKVVSAREKLTTSLHEASLHESAAAEKESRAEDRPLQDRPLAEGRRREDARREEEQREGLPLVLSLAGSVERARTTRELAVRMQAAQLEAQRAAERATEAQAAFRK